MLAVVLVTAGLVYRAASAPPPDEMYATAPGVRDAGSSNDPAHRKFAEQFVREQSQKLGVVDGFWVGPDRFRVIVPGNMSRDDIDYLGRFAGQKILHDLGFRPVVQVYAKSAGGGLVPAATAQWESRKFGFVTTIREQKTK